jgi:transcription regulator MmyB-like protein
VICFGTGGRDEARASSICRLTPESRNGTSASSKADAAYPAGTCYRLFQKSWTFPSASGNVLLLASGYAPLYSEYEWDTPEMAAVTQAVDRLLLQHEPHPALVLDRYWNVIRTNASAPQFFGSFIDLDARPRPRNLLHLIFDPEGMRPFIEDWEEVATGLLQRVRREALGHVMDATTVNLLNDLRKYPGVKELSSVPKAQSPVLPITFVRGHERRSYFSLITTVGTPQCVTAQELRIECMFSLDAGSR